MQERRTEVDVYRLLRRLQGRLIPRVYGLVHFPVFIPSRSTFLALSSSTSKV